ncbi:MAG: YCF48-related protein [Chitinophagaceae bacterium]
MQKAINSLFLILAISILASSCSKDNNPDTNPTTPTDPTSPPGTQPGTGDLPDTLGAGWQKIKVDTTVGFTDIFFVDNNNGFLCGESYIGKSTDGGLTWKKVLPESIKGVYVNIFFVDANTGWVFGGTNSNAMRTIDGGNTWLSVGRGIIFDGQFFDAKNGFVIAEGFGVFKTSDGGVTFQSVSGFNARSLFFQDKNKGWVSGKGLIKTTDGGTTFTNLTDAIPIESYAMQFTDSLHGWIAGGASIYRTVDGGATVESIRNGQINSDISFFDNNNGFILSGTKIFSTSDGGKTLQLQCVIHKNSPYEIHFTDSSHGWAAGPGGYIYKYVKP